MHLDKSGTPILQKNGNINNKMLYLMSHADYESSVIAEKKTPLELRI